jgi:hypothetical protein
LRPDRDLFLDLFFAFGVDEAKDVDAPNNDVAEPKAGAGVADVLPNVAGAGAGTFKAGAGPVEPKVDVGDGEPKPKPPKDDDGALAVVEVVKAPKPPPAGIGA